MGTNIVRKLHGGSTGEPKAGGPIFLVIGVVYAFSWVLHGEVFFAETE